MATNHQMMSKKPERDERPNYSLPIEQGADTTNAPLAARHNADIWDNENGFRNQADGYFG